MASKEGYALSKEGLSDMLKDQQRGFLQAYDGCEGLCKALGSDSAAGLGGDAGDLASRRETYGANYIEPPAMKTYWELILEGCEDNTVQALIICATVSLIMIVAEKPSHRFVASIEGVAIFLTVAFCLTVRRLEDLDTLEVLADEATFYDKQWNATWEGKERPSDSQ